MSGWCGAKDQTQIFLDARQGLYQLIYIPVCISNFEQKSSFTELINYITITPMLNGVCSWPLFETQPCVSHNQVSVPRSYQNDTQFCVKRDDSGEGWSESNRMLYWQEDIEGQTQCVFQIF